MAVSPLEIPGKILVRGVFSKNCNYFLEVIDETTAECKDILEALEIEQLSDFQERILFALKDGLDIYVAGAKHTGKKTAYLIPVLQHILGQLYNVFKCKLPEQERKAAPAALFICESTESGIRLKLWIEEILQKISRASTNRPVVTFLDNVQNETMLTRLTEPVDVLILTGAVLPKFLPSLGLKFNRTRYIIFEEFGMKNYYEGDEILRFLKTHDKIDGDSVLQKLPPNAQLIFSGTIWQNSYIGSTRRELCALKRKSVMLFGSSLHALQFSTTIKWKMDHVTSDKAKLNSLIGICKVMLNESRKIVVACGTADVAIKVSEYISEIGELCNTLITCENRSTSGVFNTNVDWLGSIFVVADDAWPDFDVYDASCLIHFDIALERSISEEGDEEGLPFCLERFSCMWIKMEREWQSSSELPGLTHFLLSGNEPNFIALYKFLQTVNIPLPHSLEEIAEQRLEKELLSKPFCANLKCFGSCNTSGCPSRHQISKDDLDTQPDAPTKGELEFKVIESINPSLYVVKLLSHYVVDENPGEKRCVKTYREEARERVYEMIDYYSVERNRVHPQKFSPGELVCVPFNRQQAKEGHNRNAPAMTMYLRARIDRLVYEAFDGSSSTSDDAVVSSAVVFCLDFGAAMEIALNNIMVLPERFRKWKPHCVQLVLSNLLYPQEGREYFSDALEAAKSLADGKVFHGKVLLSLRDTVWVDQMVQYDPDPVTGQLISGCNLTEEYNRNHYASLCNNYNLMGILSEYIRRTDPSYPEIEHELDSSHFVQDFQRKGDLLIWTDLPLSKVDKNDMHDLEPVPFTIKSLRTPWEIYGTVCGIDIDKDLLKLEEAMSKEIDSSKAAKANDPSKYAALLEVGSVVAVQVSKNSRWLRGFILGKSQMKDDVCNMVDVLLVDYGTTVYNLRESEQVVPIRKVYVNEIPFQAVCLKMSHIQPNNEGVLWQDVDTEQFSTFIQLNQNVDVIAFTKLMDSDLPCNYYEAMAYRKIEGSCVENVYQYEEMGVELLKKKRALPTAAMEKVISAVRILSADDNAGETSSIGSTDISLDFNGILADDDGEDGDSETSFEKRFQDVELENGEYVAIDGATFEDSFEKLEMSEPSRTTNELANLEEKKMIGNSATNEVCYSTGKNDDDDNVDEFYDAFDGDLNENCFPQETIAVCQVQEWLLKKT